MTDENHYTDLQSVYQDMIDRHQSLKSKVNQIDRDDPEYGRLVASRDEAIQQIKLVEDLLNEWANADDRDGKPDE